MTSVEIFVCIVAGVLGYLAVSHFLDRGSPPTPPDSTTDHEPR